MDAQTHTVILVVVAGREEIRCQARIAVAVHVAIHRSAHSHLARIEIIGHVIVRMVVGQSTVKQLGTLGSRLDET